MQRRRWTQEEIETLSRLYPDHYASEVADILGRGVSAIYCKARELGIDSSPEKIQRAGYEGAMHPAALATRFKNGSVPLNKGKKVSAEVYAKIQPSMFKKGHTPANHRDVGSEWIDRDGYVFVKVAEPDKWKQKHRVVWESVNGAIPEGYNVQFKNHNRQDCRIENLYLISREDQIKTENAYWVKYPKVLQEIIRLKGIVKRLIHKIDKNE